MARVTATTVAIMKVLPYITSRYGKRLFAVAVLVVTYSSPDTPLALLYRRLTIS